MPAATRTFLLIVDGSAEMPVALRYAATRALVSNARLMLLAIIPPQPVTEWGLVQEALNTEHHLRAQETLTKAAELAYSITGRLACLEIAGGEPTKLILKVLQANPNIANLFLAANTKSADPGPLVSYFSRQGLKELRVPLVLIPDGLPDELFAL